MNHTDWLITGPLYGAPQHRPDNGPIQTEKERLLAVWSQYIAPVAENGSTDFEDFYEAAARLDAAATAFGPEHCWVSLGQPTASARNLGTGVCVPRPDVSHLPRWGAQAESDLALQPTLAVERLAAGYPQLRAFVENAGRRVAAATCGPAGNLVDEVMRLATLGDGHLLIKIGQNKYGIAVICISEPGNRETVHDQLIAGLGWSLAHLEGIPDAFLVQQFTPMEYEYRFFVVDGDLITGAGCVEERTPLDNRAPFDPAVRRRRGTNDSVVDRPDLVSRYSQFGRAVAAQIRREQPALTHYVMDVASDQTGAPLVVELNALLNSGLYASRPRLVASALAAQTGA